MSDHKTTGFSIFESGPLALLLTVLNNGRSGISGLKFRVAVHASSKGFRIVLNGKTIAKGATPQELHKSYEAAQEKAKNAKP